MGMKAEAVAHPPSDVQAPMPLLVMTCRVDLEEQQPLSGMAKP